MKGEQEMLREIVEIVIFRNCIKNHISSEKYIWFFSLCKLLPNGTSGKNFAMNFSSFSYAVLYKQRRGFS